MSIQFPNMKQVYAARDCLRDVLVNEQRLCPAVDKIEYVGQIERFGQLHYIFKFREPGGPWLVGVSGGYRSKDQIEPGEYVGSMGDAYNEGTVKGSAIALLDDMKSFMEGQEMDAIKAALEDEDVAGMMREIKELAERNGLEISEEEIKRRVIDIMRTKDPSELEDLEDMEHDGWSEMKDGLEHVILLKDHSFTAEDAKNAVVESFSHAWDLQCKKTDDGYVVQVLGYTVDIESLGRPWEIPENEQAVCTEKESAKAYENHKDALSIWVYEDRDQFSTVGAGLCLTMAVAGCLQKAGKRALTVLSGRQLLDPENYKHVAERFRRSGQYPVENFLHPSIQKGPDKGDIYLGTCGLSSLLDMELWLKQPLPGKEASRYWEDVLWISMHLLQEDESAPSLYIEGGDDYSYRITKGRRDGQAVFYAERTETLILENVYDVWDHLQLVASSLRRPASANRPMYFLVWAERKGFLTKKGQQKIDLYRKTHTDERNFIRDVCGDRLLSNVLTKKGKAFAKSYYHYGLIMLADDKERETYYTDLQEYAKLHITGRRAWTIQKAGIDVASFLPWDEETKNEVAAMIEKRYEEWERNQ